MRASRLCLLSLCLPGFAAAQAAPRHAPFRVMSYNVRQVNADDTGRYAWAARSPAVRARIAADAPDVFGVQESSSPLIQGDLAAAFEADYDRFQPDNGSPKTIFFRRDRFERLPDLPEAEVQGIIGFANPYAESDACHPNAQGRTAAWLKLRDRVSGRGYLFVNAHIAHGGACWAARLSAADELHALIAARGGGLTPVLFGDLNSDAQAAGADPHEAVAERLEAPQPGYTLRRSARHTGETTADTETFNSAWKGASDRHTRLDYIFVGISDAATSHQTVDRTLVDGISPSDHFPILATIVQAPFSATPLRHEHAAAGDAALAFADVTGDGRADKLLWASGLSGGRVQVYPGEATGLFGAPLPGEGVETPETPAGEALFFADVTGDGCADRLAWAPATAGGALRVFPATCDGGFALAGIAGPAAPAGTARFAFGRLDADACVDGLRWDPAGGGLPETLHARCDGTFDAPVRAAGAGASANPDAWMWLADVDGDGLADQVVWDPTAESGATRVYRRTGDAGFALLQVHTGGTSVVPASRFHFADVDADGHADKLFWRSSFRQGHLQLYPGGADGLYAHPTMVDATPSTSATHRYFLADVNGDAAADLIAWDMAQAPDETTTSLALTGRAPEPPPPEPPPDAAPRPRDAASTDAEAGDAAPPLHADRTDAAAAGTDAGPADAQEASRPPAPTAEERGLVHSGGCRLGSGGPAPWTFGLGLLFCRARRRRLTGIMESPH